MKCFYHDDADGICSGFWVASSAIVNDKEYYTDKPEFYEVNYRKKFPIEIIRKNEQVYIADFSITPEEMRELLKVTENVTWIDHHKSAIQQYEDFEYNIRGLRYDGIAACMLTYCYLKHMSNSGEGTIKPFDLSMVNDAPLFTKLIADSDMFDFKHGDDTRCFFTAFNSYNFHPQSEKWDLFNDNGGYETKMIGEGRIMKVYEAAWAKDYLKLGFETEFEGYRCFAINLGYSGIDFFDSIPDGLYDIFISFAFDGMQHVVSMYSKSDDVSSIAKKYGGGGHKMAAGFRCIDLPFKKFK